MSIDSFTINSNEQIIGLNFTAVNHNTVYFLIQNGSISVISSLTSFGNIS